jgi:hypothetical protein
MEPGLLAARFCCFHLSCLLHHSPSTLSNLSCTLSASRSTVRAPLQRVQTGWGAHAAGTIEMLVAALVGMFFTCS